LPRYFSQKKENACLDMVLYCAKLRNQSDKKGFWTLAKQMPGQLLLIWMYKIMKSHFFPQNRRQPKTYSIKQHQNQKEMKYKEDKSNNPAKKIDKILSHLAVTLIRSLIDRYFSYSKYFHLQFSYRLLI